MKFDLEDRTAKFAQDVRDFVKKLPRTISNIEDGKQLARSSGSVGANYIEANEGLSKKDFLMRLKICRKEAKESRYWIKMVDLDKRPELEEMKKKLAQEAKELLLIFNSIINKSTV